MGGILAAIQAMGQAIAKVFGFATQRDAEKNAPDVRNAVIDQKEQDAQDKTKKAIASGDLNEQRKELSE